MLRILYSKPKSDLEPFYKPSQTFQQYFPDVYSIFKQIKEVEYTFLPLILQRIESFLVLDVICKRISELEPDMPLFTIHDSILSTQGNEDIIEAVMTQELTKWIGYAPILKTERLLPFKVQGGNSHIESDGQMNCCASANSVFRA